MNRPRSEEKKKIQKQKKARETANGLHLFYLLPSCLAVRRASLFAGGSFSVFAGGSKATGERAEGSMCVPPGTLSLTSPEATLGKRLGAGAGGEEEEGRGGNGVPIQAGGMAGKRARASDETGEAAVGAALKGWHVMSRGRGAG